jgi:Base plate wedge protein 53
MYFSKFKKIVYAFNFGDELSLRVVRDITSNMRPIQRILENTLYYGDYDIEDNETPEVIAERVYGNPNLHWVLMLVNEKYHYLNDWPIPENKLDEYVTKKYGAGNENSVHMLYGRPHYVSPEGRIVDAPEIPGATLDTAVTNLEYERALNDEKRRIRIVLPNLINIFIKDLEEAFPSER